MLDQFAEELKKAREKSGISLQQMAAKTRIDIKFLEAIDQGNFSFLPELYVKAFLKQYAKTIGIDEEETARKYDAAKFGKAPVEVDDQKTIAQPEKPVDTKPQAPGQPVKTYTDVSTIQQKAAAGTDQKATIIMIASVLGVIALTIFLYMTVFQKSSDIIVEEKPFEEVIEDSQPRFTEEKNNQLNIPATPVITDSLLLKFTNVDSADTSWIFVISDNSVQQDFLLYPRSAKTVKAASVFRFTLGNSGVVKVELDNRAMQFEGRRKSVRHFKVDNSGIERLSSPPSLVQN